MIKILHLYYDLMNLYGDYANLIVLCDNLKRNNIDYTLDKFSIDDDFDFDDYDFIYCGSGTEMKTDIAFNDFIKRKESFFKAFNNNKIFVFTGSSSLFFGKKYDSKDSFNIFDFNVIKGDKRISGDVVINTKEYINVVGYLNTSFIVSGNGEYASIIGSENDIKNYQGIAFKKNNLLAVNLTGPLLVKNPLVLKDYITKLGIINDSNYKYIDHIKQNQYKCYDVTLNELKKRFNVE